MREVIEDSDKRWFSTAATTMFLFYCGLGCLDALWYFIYFGRWSAISLAVGLLGWFLVNLCWRSLWNDTFYSRDFLYSVDEKIIYGNGVFMRMDNQAYLLRKKFYSWDVDTEKLEKLPVRIYYNAWRKAVDIKVNIHTTQVLQVR